MADLDLPQRTRVGQAPTREGWDCLRSAGQRLSFVRRPSSLASDLRTPRARTGAELFLAMVLSPPLALHGGRPACRLYLCPGAATHRGSGHSPVHPPPLPPPPLPVT